MTEQYRLFSWIGEIGMNPVSGDEDRCFVLFEEVDTLVRNGETIEGTEIFVRNRPSRSQAGKSVMVIVSGGRSPEHASDCIQRLLTMAPLAGREIVAALAEGGRGVIFDPILDSVCRLTTAEGRGPSAHEFLELVRNAERQLTHPDS